MTYELHIRRDDRLGVVKVELDEAAAEILLLSGPDARERLMRGLRCFGPFVVVHVREYE